MKSVFILLLLVAECTCELGVRYYHYTNGTITQFGTEPVHTDGPIFIEFLRTMNITVISGTHLNGVAFAFAAKITMFYESDGNFIMEGDCWEGSWGLHKQFKTVGHVRLCGSWTSLHYRSECASPDLNTNWTVNELGASASKCPFYAPAEAAIKASTLLGQQRSLYGSVHVVSYATVGYPYVHAIQNCTWYLQNLKKNATKAAAGLVVVGLDGKHCGVVDREGDKFIHSDPKREVVAATPLVRLHEFFPKGVVYKDYTC